jgi:RNA polymerase sigma-70 factor (ECF subfamily)
MEKPLKEKNKISQFEQIVLPHLDAAYNLARWLTKNDHDAEDLVQMAFVRAVRFFDGYQGGNPRAWLLTIVRHTFYTTLRDNPRDGIDFDEALHSNLEQGAPFGVGSNPESNAASQDTSRIVNQALEQLPNNFREIVILKEIEELSYKEIADLADIPIGTVMSRLSRGRKLLAEYLQKAGIGGTHGV